MNISIALKSIELPLVVAVVDDFIPIKRNFDIEKLLIPTISFPNKTGKQLRRERRKNIKRKPKIL